MGILSKRPKKETDRLRAFGLRVQHLRKMKDISQERLASMVGYSRAHMGFIEQGKVSAPLVKVFRIADALQIPVRDLFEF